MRTSIVAGILVLIFSLSCKNKGPEYIMTVSGTVNINQAGLVLSHEHIMVDWIGADSTGTHRWNKDSVIAKALPYLLDIKKIGVKTFVDCTPAYLGRDVEILRALSEKSGIQIITNTGYYGAVNNRYMPKTAWQQTAEEIAAHWISEFENGIDSTTIKPGFIKISVKEDTLLSDLHRKIVTAAAITHKATGLVIKSHTGGDIPAFDQLKLLESMGVEPSAFIWTHAQMGTLEKNLEAAKLGAWVSLDGVNASEGKPASALGNINFYVQRLVAFKKAGLLNNVLISQDAGQYNVGRPSGGIYRPYTDIFSFLIPKLFENGFTHTDIDQLLIKNPANAFKIRK